MRRVFVIIFMTLLLDNCMYPDDFLLSDNKEDNHNQQSNGDVIDAETDKPIVQGCCLLNQAKLKSVVPYSEATKLVFDLKKNSNTYNCIATGKYVDEEENNLQVYCNGTEYYIISENNSTIWAPDICNGLFSIWDYSSLESIEFNSFCTDSVTDMSNMFYLNSALRNLDISMFNTENVKDMNHMFAGCSVIEDINISNFRTKSVTSSNAMFESCSSLTSLDLCCFETYNISDMSNMFSNCSNLKTIYVSNSFEYEQANIDDMFVNCVAVGNYGPNSQLTIKNMTSSLERPDLGVSY